MDNRKPLVDIQLGLNDLKQKWLDALSTGNKNKLANLLLQINVTTHLSFFQEAIIHFIKTDNAELLKLILQRVKGRDLTFLLNQPLAFDVPTENKTVSYPLIYAIQNRKISCASLLIELGADVNVFNTEHLTLGNHSVKEDKLLGTALTAAIENNLTNIAIMLCESGANTNVAYKRSVSIWRFPDIGTRYYAASFDPEMTPFLMAAKYNNFELVDYFLGKGENKDNHQTQPALRLTTDQKIKNLLLDQYTFAERLHHTHFTGDIPVKLRCFISKTIMTEPVTYEMFGRKITFCKRALQALNENRRFNGKMIGPTKTEIKLDEYVKILKLKVREDLQKEAREFVEEAEKTTELRRDPNHKFHWH